MNIREIHMDNTNRCRVVVGPTGRTYHSTPQAVGLALLGVAPVEPGDAVSGMTWYDYLSTHGVAVGTRGDRQTHLAIIPSKPRTVSYTWTDSHGAHVESLTLSFPPVLALLRLHQGAFERAALFMPDMARQSHLTVTSQTPVLTSFPYGNVHTGSGHICWGGIPTRDVRTIADLEALFFGSGFNHDLFAPGPIGHGGLRAAVAAAPGGVLPALRTAHYTITVPSALSHLGEE